VPACSDVPSTAIDRHGRWAARPTEGGNPRLTDEPKKNHTYRAGFDAFGSSIFFRTRSLIDQSGESKRGELSGIARRRQVIVAAEVARNYFELRGLQQQLAVAERSLPINARTFISPGAARCGHRRVSSTSPRGVRWRPSRPSSADPRRPAEREHRLAVSSARVPAISSSTSRPAPIRRWQKS